jgi:hypothetical protein
MNPTFTREVNGNPAIRLGKDLRDLEGVHKRGEDDAGL